MTARAESYVPGGNVLVARAILRSEMWSWDARPGFHPPVAAVQHRPMAREGRDGWRVMSPSLHMVVSELQRLTNQLEDSLGEVDLYGPRQREQAARALSSIASRIELIRMAVLDPGVDEVEDL